MQMNKVYSNYILRWCRDFGASSYKNASDVDILTEFINCYVSYHKVNTEVITDNMLHSANAKLASTGYKNKDASIGKVPFKFVMKAGTYFEMEPDVWRLVCTNVDTYNAYAKFLGLSDKISLEKSIANKDSILIKVYGKELTYDIVSARGIWSVDNMKDSELIDTIKEYFRKARPNYMTQLVYKSDIVAIADKTNCRLYAGNIHSSYILDSGLYIRLKNDDWRQLVEDVDTLKDYYHIICEN